MLGSMLAIMGEAGMPTVSGQTRVGGRAVRGEIAYEEFASRCRALAKELVSDPKTNEESYLHEIAALAVRLTSVPERPFGRFGTYDPPVEFGPLSVEAPLFVIQWRLAPGATLPPHNHPNANVVSLGLEGEARIRNFEVDGDAPDFASTKAFRVRQTHDEFITAGRVNMLSSTRDNIHTFHAGPQGARGIDIGTLVGKQDAFAFVEMGSKAIDAERRVFEARWAKA